MMVFFFLYDCIYWSVEVHTKCEMLPSANKYYSENYSESTSLNETQIVIIILFRHMLSCLKNRVRKKFSCSLSELSVTLPFPPISDGILDRQKPVIMPTHLESSWTGNMASEKQKFIRKDFQHFFPADRKLQLPQGISWSFHSKTWVSSQTLSSWLKQEKCKTSGPNLQYEHVVWP